LDELCNNMWWWFRASNHDVKTTILAKFDDQHNRLSLETWEEEISHQEEAITRDE
ncbi:hypothetical protein BT67DRAFT_364898, partial [Trichocladium antarcticum]